MFSTRVRDRLDKKETYKHYIQLFGSDPMMNLLAWKAFNSGVILPPKKKDKFVETAMKKEEDGPEDKLIMAATEKGGKLESEGLDPLYEELKQWDDLIKEWK